ncbi:MAG: HTH domain-containing protein [Alphaproteobacteria bacterium]|nr:HTH domain-containing protein [Alphaproteobacteria bacterium]
MRRADRLFDVIQTLRSAKRPMTAAALAEALEVTVRTIYRDVATLQARRVPIEGAPGVGYVLRKGFDLPPLMFTVDEVEAIAVGARMVRRLRDQALQQAAGRVLDKVTVVLPQSLRGHMTDAPI